MGRAEEAAFVRRARETDIEVPTSRGGTRSTLYQFGGRTATLEVSARRGRPLSTAGSVALPVSDIGLIEQMRWAGVLEVDMPRVLQLAVWHAVLGCLGLRPLHLLASLAPGVGEAATPRMVHRYTTRS